MNRVISVVQPTLACALILAVDLSALAAQATFTACRVPSVGVIYMIGVSGAPSACLDASHVEFRWTEGGPPVDGSITTLKLADGAVTQAKLDAGVTLPPGTGSVGTAQLANGAVTAAKIATAAVTSEKIVDGGIAAADIAPNSIDGARVIDGSLTVADLAAGSVAAPQIVTGAVGSAHVADLSLTAADLAAGSVTALQIDVGAVGSIQVADGSIFAADLAPNSVGSSELALEIVTVVESTARVNDVIGATAFCPIGKTPIAGGFRWTSHVPGNVADAALQLSHPTALGWIVTYRDPSPYGITGLEVYAVCVTA